MPSDVGSRRVLVPWCGVVLLSVTGCSAVIDLDQLGAGTGGGDASTSASTSSSSASTGVGGLGGGGGAAAEGCDAYPDATFCVDFSEPDPFNVTLWSSTDVGSSEGSITLDTSLFTSAPAAARMQLANPASDCAYMELRKDFQGDFAELVLQLRVRFETTGNFLTVITRPDDTFDYRTIYTVDTTGSGYYVGAFFQRLDEGGGVVTDPGVSPEEPEIQLAAWLPVEVIYRADPPEILATIDGKVFPLEAPADFVVRDPSIVLGPYCGGEPAVVIVDDVVVTLTE